MLYIAFIVVSVSLAGICWFFVREADFLEKQVDRLATALLGINNNLDKLQAQMDEFHQFYCIDSEDDESFVCMFRKLEERVNRLELIVPDFVYFETEEGEE